ncbi:MAG TPA: hypothetical protein VGY48_15455 [Vicinamibacterales bacterium]|jgi:hypothetical protein|nr:hypothetical protein [Vicinamibacterales bacterium]
MVEPGVFEHYKGNRYRVLFTAMWADYERPQPDDDVLIYVESTRAREGSSAALAAVCGGRHPTGIIMTVKWSGNLVPPHGETAVSAGDVVVIYVSLSEKGRLSARTEVEFEEKLSGGFSGVERFRKVEP